MNPTECRMPDLGEGIFSPVMGHYILKVVFNDTGQPSNRTVLAYVVSFIRILDKAIREYNHAKEELQAYIDSASRTTLLLNATGHLETCIHSLQRCLVLFRRMRAVNFGDSASARLLRKSVEAVSEDVPTVRNAIEHIDDRIARDEVAEGRPIALMISEAGDRASIAGEDILFTDVAGTIRKLHGLGV